MHPVTKACASTSTDVTELLQIAGHALVACTAHPVVTPLIGFQTPHWKPRSTLCLLHAYTRSSAYPSLDTGGLRRLA